MSGGRGMGKEVVWGCPYPRSIAASLRVSICRLKLPFGAKSGLAFGIKKKKNITKTTHTHPPIQMGLEISDVSNSCWFRLQWELN